MVTYSSILPWRTPGQRSLMGYSPQGRKESDTSEVNEHARTQAYLFLVSSFVTYWSFDIHTQGWN